MHWEAILTPFFRQSNTRLVSRNYKYKLHNVQNAQISLYPKFQIILCKIDIAVYVFGLVQAGLKWAFWAEKKTAMAL